MSEGGRGPKILIVEDERLVARDFQGILGGLGFKNSECVCSGEDALRSVEATPPDVVFMDIKLKRELDGIATAGLVRARHDIPVVFMSALSDTQTRNRAASIDRAFFITKPFCENEIMEVLKSAGVILG